jgi:hypothetical protein
MTPLGINPATFRFIAQYLNNCATACPRLNIILKLVTQWDGYNNNNNNNSNGCARAELCVTSDIHRYVRDAQNINLIRYSVGWWHFVENIYEELIVVESEVVCQSASMPWTA